MPYAYFDQIYTIGVPAFYNANLTVSLTGRKPTLKIEGFDFVSPINLQQQAVTK
jgi:hypothetical protein